MLFFTSVITLCIIEHKQTGLCLRTCYPLRFCVTLPVLHFTNHAIIRLISIMRSNKYLLFTTGRLSFYCACVSCWSSKMKFQHEVVATCTYYNANVEKKFKNYKKKKHEVVARHCLKSIFHLGQGHMLIDYKSHQFCPSWHNIFYPQ